jgi:predicted ArsR family transcriptional regulator
VADTGLSEEVKKFITEHISSVEQLEVLLLLHHHLQQAWSAQEVSQELRIDPASAAERLADLEARGLLARREAAGGGPPAEDLTADPLYQYQPQKPHFDHTVSDLAKFYQEYRVTVISLIFSKPIDKIRTFADAFKLRKDKGNG